MKLLGVKTMMSGCGEKDCPITGLIDIPVDFVLVAPWLTIRTDDRDMTNVMNSFLTFLRNIPVDVIGEGVRSDTQIAALSRADCWGYIPSSAYEGSVTHGRLRMTLEEAISQNEEDI